MKSDKCYSRKTTHPKKLLIVNQMQFGYHSDTYYYCKYLKNDYDIKYFCFDEDKPRLYLDKVEVIYLTKKGNRILIEIRFFIKLILLILKKKSDFTLIKYFKGCSLLSFFIVPQKILVDIRSASVLKKRWQRIFFDLIMKVEIRFFKHITVISKGLAKRLRLPERAKIIPLGADIHSKISKKMDKLRFLYVGTLYNRNIEHTILGFHRFFNEYKDRLPISYTIIGDGLSNEKEMLDKLVGTLNLNHCIKLTGRIPQHELQAFFDSHNIGISYVPVTDYYNYQPPTKTYEYLLSGMPVIATQTHENMTMVDDTCGILIPDTPEGVYLGMCDAFLRSKQFNSDEIRQAHLNHTWENVTGSLNNILIGLKT